jgi:hypothetical protein
MGLFERFRSDSAKRAETARAKLDESAGRLSQTERSLDATTRRAAYAQARLTELLPCLREHANLEIQERIAGAKIDRAREMAALLAGAKGPAGAAVAAKRVEVEEDLRRLETDHAKVANRVAAVASDLEARDRELRARFGLGD